MRIRSYGAALCATKLRGLYSLPYLTTAQRPLSSRTIDTEYSQNYVQDSKRPSAYGWQYHLDNTIQFILWASFGSAAIHLLNVKQKYAEKDRKLSTKIAILKDVIRRIGEGEDVDVAKELKVGKTDEEREWEDVLGAFREEAEGVKLDSTLSPVSAKMSTSVAILENMAGETIPTSDSNIVQTGSSTKATKSGWFWSTA